MSRFLSMACMLALLFASVAACAADPVAQREDQFKAAYVFNFVKFVAWPDDEAAGPLLICFVGGQDVYQALAAAIENKRIGSRPLVALLLADAPSSGTCRVLYIDASVALDYTRIDGPVLTISDSHDFVARGGMIELFTENHRLRFLVNVRSAQQAGLRISSDLLKLAAGVQRGAQ
jgi:hypothetical protein